MSDVVKPGSAGKDGTQEGSPKALGTLGTAIAVVLIALWVGGLAYLWQHLQDTEATWVRNLVIFHSIEAAAFAAAGALLGVHVNRVKESEKAAQDAKAETAKEKKISLIGERLASTVLVEKGHAPLTLDTDHRLWQDKAGMPMSVEIAQELLDARSANP